MGMSEEIIGTDTIGAEMSPTDFLAAASSKELIQWLRQFQVVRPDPPRRLTIKDFTYACMLEPFLKQAWNEIEGSPGLSNRMAQMSRVYDLAQARMEREGGIPRAGFIIDFPSFLAAYEAGEINHGVDALPDR